MHKPRKFCACIRALFVLLACNLWIFAVVAANAETSPSIHFDGSPPPYSEIMGNLWTIYADGIIDRGATARFRNFLAVNHVPPRSRLILNSDGGSLSEAMRLGELIRKYSLITDIGTKGNLNVGINGNRWYDTNPGGCYSACALVFLGGKYRFISRGSTYGVHRFYSPSKDLDADDAQVLSGSVVQYIRDMGIDPALFALMTEAGPSEIIRVPGDLQIQLNVVNNGAGPTVWSVETPPNVSGMYLKGARETWRGMNKFMLVCAPKGPVMLMVLYYGEGRGKEIVNTYTEHLLFVNDNEIPITHLLTGKLRLRVDNDEVFAEYLLTDELLNKMATAKTVGIGMKPSANSLFFMGFIGMPFADGARKLPGFLRACHS
jgi:hypothetical protein